MSQKEKQLLLVDLCARLPYGFTVHRYSDNQNITFGKNELDVFSYFLEYSEGEEFKPYLRSTSSITEEEKNEVAKLGVCYDLAFHNDIYDTGISMEESFLVISWFLERHFDINHLIEKGLAIEAPEDMYKIK